MVGFALAARPGPLRPSTWAEFFDARVDLPRPGRRAATTRRSSIGAALVAAGHDWNSSAAPTWTTPRAPAPAARQPRRSAGASTAAGCDGGLGRASARASGSASPGTASGSSSRPRGRSPAPRLLCIPPYAPDPVSAHAWLNHALDPLTAARDTIRTGRATPVGEAVVRAPAVAPRQPGGLPARAAARAARRSPSLTPAGVEARGRRCGRT